MLATPPKVFFRQKKKAERSLKIFTANHYFIFLTGYGENRIKKMFIDKGVAPSQSRSQGGGVVSDLKMLVFNVKNALEALKCLDVVYFHPLISFYNISVHLELFFYRYRKIRDLRAATGKSEIVTSSEHKKGCNFVKN